MRPEAALVALEAEKSPPKSSSCKENSISAKIRSEICVNDESAVENLRA